MNNRYQHFLLPLGVIVGGGWLIRLCDSWLKGSWVAPLLALLILAVQFIFGLRLNGHKKRNDAWFKKLIISFVLLILVLLRLNIAMPSIVTTILYWLALDGFAQSLLVVYLGWLFFD